MHALYLLAAVFLTSARSSPSRNTCGHSAWCIGSTVRDQPAEACAANPDQTLTTPGVEHMQITWAGFQEVVFAVHTLWSWDIHPELERTGALAILVRTNRKYVSSPWLRFFFSPQKVPCFGRLEHVGFVLRNKPAIIPDLGEYLKAQSGRILQIN